MNNLENTISSVGWKKTGTFGLYVPEYIRFVKPMENIIAYLTFSEIFPNEPNSIEEIKKIYLTYFNRDILQVLGKLNYILATKYDGKVDDYPFANAILFDSKIVGLDKWRGVRKYASRQQMLSNLKMAILCASDNPKKFVHNDKKKFGKLIYRITEYLEGALKDSHEPEIVRALMARNMLLNSSLNFYLAIARYYYIFNKLSFGNKQYFKDFFKKYLKIDFNFYLWVGFAIWGFYERKNYKHRLSKPNEFILSGNYFAKANKYTKKNYSKAISLISNNIEGFKKELIKEEKLNGELYSFQAFFRSPLIRDKDTFFLLDKHYLEQRITEGAFWQIFDDAKSNNLKRKLKGYWGKVFERYVYDLIKSVYKDDERIVSEIADTKQETYGVDVLLNYPKTLITIEITTRKIPYNVWIEANPKNTKKFIKELLIGNGKRGKAVQLHDLWLKIKNKEAKIENITDLGITRIIPIIVFEDVPPVHQGLWAIYEEVLLECGLRKEFVDTLIFWSVKDLETALGLVEEGKSLIDIIDSASKSGYLHDSINNFLNHTKQKVRYPKFCRDNFEDWGKDTNLLFR